MEQGSESVDTDRPLSRAERRMKNKSKGKADSGWGDTPKKPTGGSWKGPAKRGQTKGLRQGKGRGS